MELKNISEKIGNSLKKYKFVVLILLLGILLMMLPSTNTKSKNTPEAASPLSQKTDTLEQQLSSALSRVKGAGNVQVILTVDRGEETIYQADKSSSGSNETRTEKSDTVTVDKKGLITQINPPVYKGAIILCQGADTPSVKYAMVEAVSKITGIGADNICVLKMK